MNRDVDRFTDNMLFDEEIGDTVHTAVGRACGRRSARTTSNTRARSASLRDRNTPFVRALRRNRFLAPMDYEASLTRAYDALPEQARTEGNRLSIPDPAGETDGAFTRLTNIDEIADAVNRDTEHLHRAIQRALGTSGQFEGDRARYNGSFDAADFDAAVQSYVAEFVTCSECGLPDTVLKTEDGIEMLRCQACGAFRPVEKNTTRTSNVTQDEIEEGKTYELQITGTGRKGDGVAERGSYTIFVPGAREGDVVRAVIEDTSGNLAFARLV